jgi:hypothetical protein
MPILTFGKYRYKDISVIPDTYLDYVIGQPWFFNKKENEATLNAIVKELDTRRRSHFYIEDDYGKTLEDL